MTGARGVTVLANLPRFKHLDTQTLPDSQLTLSYFTDLDFLARTDCKSGRAGPDVFSARSSEEPARTESVEVLSQRTSLVDDAGKEGSPGWMAIAAIAPHGLHHRRCILGPACRSAAATDLGHTRDAGMQD